MSTWLRRAHTSLVIVILVVAALALEAGKRWSP
jgi:hypothetical protein